MNPMNKEIFKSYKFWAFPVCIILILILIGIGRIYAQIQEINVFEANIKQDGDQVIVTIQDSLSSSEWKIKGEKLKDFHQSSRNKSEAIFAVTSDSKDGEFKLELQQVYTIPLINYRFRSESRDISTTIDFTPPEGDLQIENLTDLTNKTTHEIKVRRTNSDIIAISLNGKPSVKFDGDQLPLTLDLVEGANTFEIRSVDAKGNSKEGSKFKITRDTTPPTISLFLGFCSNNKTETAEDVCLSQGNFHGPLTGNASMPITGKVLGNIEKITYDGKTLNVDKYLNINQRIQVYVRQGDNNYEVKVVDKAGNESVKIDTLSWLSDEELAQEVDNEVTDRLDDIESKIDDIND